MDLLKLNFDGSIKYDNFDASKFIICYSNRNSLFVLTIKRISKPEVLVAERTTFRQGLLAKWDSKIIVVSINSSLQLPSWRITILVRDIKCWPSSFFVEICS